MEYPALKTFATLPSTFTRNIPPLDSLTPSTLTLDTPPPLDSLTPSTLTLDTPPPLDSLTPSTLTLDTPPLVDQPNRNPFYNIETNY